MNVANGCSKNVCVIILVFLGRISQKTFLYSDVKAADIMHVKSDKCKKIKTYILIAILCLNSFFIV